MQDPSRTLQNKGGFMASLFMRLTFRHALLTVLFCAFCIAGAITGAIQGAEEPEYALWYRQPANEWTEALPVGNGRLGAMVFGGISEERIQFNEETLWDGAPNDRYNPEALNALGEVRRLLFEGKNEEATKLAGEKMMGNPPRIKSYQSFGDIRLSFPRMEHARNYRRELDLGTGVVRIAYDAGNVHFTREVFASVPDQVIAIRIMAGTPGRLDFSFTMDREQDAAAKTEGTDGLILSGRIGDYGMRFEAHASVRITNGTLSAFGDRLDVSGADEAVILLAAATSYVNQKDISGDPESICRRYLDGVSRKSYREIRDVHVRDHARLFDRVKLVLGDDDKSDTPTDERLRAVKEGADDPQLAALYFQYGRYLLMGSSRPGCLPANLQGIWNEHMNAPWNSDFHTNINLQMNYWHAETANLSECHMPLFDYMEGLVESGSRTAKIHYGAEGWVVHHLSDVWGFTTPADGVWGVWPMGAAWLCQHPYEHYLFTGDKEFLKGRAYPLMKEAARFLLDFLVEAPDGTVFPGKLVTNPSHSPENAFIKPDGTKSQFTYAATMDLMIVHDLFTNCLEAIDVLGPGFDPEFKEELQSALERLAPLQISRKTGALQEWIEDYREAEPGHRHMSHLYGFHPGDQITRRGTPNLADAVYRSLVRRLAHGGGGTGWSRAWLVNFMARFGMGDQAYAHLQHLFAKCTLSNLFDTHPPFQIDGNFGGAAGIAEMLLQSHTGEIELLPALPAAWNSGNATGLCARGGFEVAMAWKNGGLAAATVLSKNGNTCTVRYRGKVVHFETGPGGTYRLNADLSLQ